MYRVSRKAKQDADFLSPFSPQEVLMGQRLKQMLDFSYTSMCVWNGRVVNNFISTSNI